MSAGGALLVDKPAGPTSHDVVARVRRALGRGARVGHAGTLDPFATGLLILLWGRSTRLAPYLSGLDKRYRVVAQLGVRSDTGDRDGVLEPVGRRAHPRPGAARPARDTLRGRDRAGAAERRRRSTSTDAAPTSCTAPARWSRCRRARCRCTSSRSTSTTTRAGARRCLCTARRAPTSARWCAISASSPAAARTATSCGATASGPLDVSNAGSLDDDRGQPDGRPVGARSDRRARPPAGTRARAGRAGGDVATDARSPRRARTGATRCVAGGSLVCVAEPVADTLRPKVVLEPAA